MPMMMFSSDLIFIQFLSPPIYFLFMNLGLKSRFAYDMYTGELWDYCLYEYDGIIGNMKLDCICKFRLDM